MDPFDAEVDDLFGNDNETAEVSQEAMDHADNSAVISDEEQAREAAVSKQIQDKLKEITSAVTKKRVLRPQPKLDVSRLTGDRGLAALSKLFRRVKFRGKGHEADDLSSMMHIIEHWAHRLHPKLPFDEIIDRIENLGSKKAVQTYVNKIRLDVPLFDNAAVSSEDEDNQAALPAIRGEDGQSVNDHLADEAYVGEVISDTSGMFVPASSTVTLSPARTQSSVDLSASPANAHSVVVEAEVHRTLTEEQLARIQRNREAALQKKKTVPSQAELDSPQ